MSGIIEYSDLNGYMQGTDVDQTQGELVCQAVNDWIESVTGRAWGETKTVTERYDYQPVIWLRHTDVTELVAINLGYPNETPTLLDADAYYFDGSGRVQLWGRFPAQWRATGYVTIEYKYGTADVPYDLQLAALGLAAGFYSWASDGHKDISRTQVGSYQVEYASGQGKTSEAMQGIISHYKLRRV